MPTVLSHTAVPLAVGLGLGRAQVSRATLLTGMGLSMLPDLDTIGFRFGIPYASEFGHRGFSHSLFFACLVSTLAAWWLFRSGQRYWPSFGFLALAMASHGLLDCFTTGGKGIALLWPFSSARFFAPIQVIRVAPISLTRFLSARGIEVLQSELKWVWLPCALLGLLLYGWRKLIPTAQSSS